MPDRFDEKAREICTFLRRACTERDVGYVAHALRAECDEARAEVYELVAAARETIELIRDLAGYEVGNMHPNDFAVRRLERAAEAAEKGGSDE